jgi:Bacterial Ig-like domain (group 3)/IPT/TIG domain/Fibronectin type III domain/FG-GAP repeat
MNTGLRLRGGGLSASVTSWPVQPVGEFLSVLAADVASRAGATVRASAGRSRCCAIALAGVAAVVLAAVPVTVRRAPQRFARSAQPRLAVPASLGAAASPALGTAERRFWVTDAGGSLSSAGGGLATTFDASGVRVRVRSAALALTVERAGRSSDLVSLPRVTPRSSGNAIAYRRSWLTEWYRNGPLGLEQGFSVARRPGGRGRLVVAMKVSGSLLVHQAGSSLLFAPRSGGPELRYGGLSANDSTGRTLAAELVVSDGTVQLQVDDTGARYPVRIDPFFQQASKLTGSGEVGSGQFGASVALSSDGNTALIAGPQDNGPGAVWVFTRSGSTWTQQGSKLAVPGQIGYGSGVALSSDGNTALIGVGGSNESYVYTRSGSTWTQQGSAITPSDATGNSSFGASVALSSDGNTALIGGPSDNPLANFPGAAWVFTRSGSSWSQQGSKLTGTDDVGASFGSSVALSSDGNTALIGGETDNGYVGAAWVFTRSSSTWSQQGSKLIGSGEVGAGDFGSSVALSSDGNTALIGGSGLLGTTAVGPADSGVGAAWVFSRTSNVWTEQGSKLNASDESGNEFFGASVSLSTDGNTALIGGAPGANAPSAGGVWTFTRSASTWTQLGLRLSVDDGTGPDRLGSGVALSGDGTLALVGGPGDNGGVGAAWSFLRLPAVSSVTPSVGPPGGGTSVTIAGSDLSAVTGVTFGSASASFTVDSATSITARSPAGSFGPVDVTVTDPRGTSPNTSADMFAYATAPAAPAAVTATPGARGATVSFTAPAANGSPITGYTVTASPGGATAHGTSSPIAVTGLSDWTPYTFTVTATNAAGTGPASSPSGSVTTLASTQTTLGADHNPTYYGTPLTFTAAVTTVQSAAGTPTGSASFTVTGEAAVPVTLDSSGKASYSPPYFLDVGDTVTADYGGDAKHDISTTAFTPTINPAVTSLSLSSSRNPATSADSLTITATVVNTSTTITPFGTVHFVADGQPLDVPVDANGQAAIDGNSLDVGDHTITASYHDDTGATPDFTDSQATIIEHITPPPPASSSPPTISGTTLRGQTLTLTHGAWSNSPSSYSDQWEDCDPTGANCVVIAGATAQTYTLTASDIGHTIRVAETAANAGGSGAEAPSAATAIVLGATSNTTLPAVSGSPIVGQMLNASNGAWQGAAPTSFAYQWQRCAGGACTDIASATTSAYRLVGADLGRTVEVVVTATSAAGSTSATSSQVGPVLASVTEIKALLSGEIAPSGKQARIAAILRRGGFVVRFLAPEPGRGTVNWFLVPRGARVTSAKPVLIATGSAAFSAAGIVTIRVRLTAAGRGVLRSDSGLRLVGKAVFTPSSQAPVQVVKSFTLRR